jgi:hypothetical protein
MPGDAANPAGAPGALDLEIDGNPGELTFDAAGGIVRGTGGELQVSVAEARAADERPGELIGALQSGGLQVATSAGDGPPDDAVTLADTQLALWNDLGGAPLAVVMDTTTYHHARQALRGDTRAHNLLDLNLLAVAAVFFDYVIIQPDLITLETEEAGFTRIVYAAPGEDAHIEALHQVAVEECAGNRDDLQNAWQTFLNSQAVELDLDQAPLSPQDDNYYAYSGQDLPSDPDEIVEYVTQQTVRAVFNDRVAGALQLPYLASSVRLPVSQELIRSHAELLLMLRRVLGHKPADGAAQPGPFTPPEPMYAPLMLGVLLDRAAKAGGGASVMDRLVELREEMSDVRKFLRDHPDRGDWHEDPRKLLNELSGRLNADLKKSGVAKAQKAALTATAGATGLAFGPAASLAVKVLQVLLPEDAAATAARRMFQCEIFLLSDITQEAAQIATVDAQVDKVWGQPMDKATRKMLNRIAHLNADPLLRIGQI